MVFVFRLMRTNSIQRERGHALGSPNVNGRERGGGGGEKILLFRVFLNANGENGIEGRKTRQGGWPPPVGSLRGRGERKGGGGKKRKK